MRLIRKFLAHNWLCIIYFNFKMLPIKQAIHLPFDFYHSIRFVNLTGKVEISSKKLYRGMIKIGGRGSEMFSRVETILDISGTLKFSGNTEIGHGVTINICENATLEFGNCVRIGAMCKIYCCKKIILGDEIDVSWECQIFDTNFHFIRDLLTNEIDKKDASIKIGSFNWIGNNVTVMKGTETPNNLIIASNSLCNKNYFIYPEYSVLGGIPVKLLMRKKARIFENIEKYVN